MARREFMLGLAILLAWGAHSVRAELAIAPSALNQFELTTGASTGDITPEPGRSAAAAKNQTLTNGSPLWAIPLKSLSATRERPIFSPSRRPPHPVVAAPRIEPPRPAAKPPEPPEQPRLTLLGTVVGELQSIGVFLDETTKDVVRLRTGEPHRGWELRSVRIREVTLVKNQREVVVALPPPDLASPQPLAAVPGQPLAAPPRAGAPIARASGQPADPPLLVPIRP